MADGGGGRTGWSSCDVTDLHSFVHESSNQDRFITELEFVQSLANPVYLNYLGQNRYFEEPSFVKYLEYLQYWRHPKYSKYIIYPDISHCIRRYPHCLFFLEMLQSPEFRQKMAHPQHKDMMHEQQFYFWQHYRTQRAKDTSGDGDVKGNVEVNVS